MEAIDFVSHFDENPRVHQLLKGFDNRWFADIKVEQNILIRSMENPILIAMFDKKFDDFDFFATHKCRNSFDKEVLCFYFFGLDKGSIALCKTFKRESISMGFKM